jgi:hypothetical protein
MKRMIMANENVRCPCQTASFAGEGTLLQEFASLRELCSALKEILVPEESWLSFCEEALKSTDAARHCFILLDAFENGFLERITSPIHRYLLEQNRPKTTLTKQYRKDLTESWMLEKSPLERHQKARIFQGRLAELRCAAWLEERKWAITGLEALGGEFDIAATSPKGIECAIEVKFIGQEDDKFEEIWESISSGDGVCGGFFNLYAGYNFLLFKVFEAANQLSTSTRRRLALIVISNMTWSFLKMQIKDTWMRDRPLRFFDVEASPEWNRFLSCKKTERRFANIEKELNSKVGSLQEVWFVNEGNFLEYSLETKLEFNEKG